MGLQHELASQGQWLFRWRSFLPLAIVPLFLFALINMSWPFGSYRFHEYWELLCLLISFAGLAIRALTAGVVPANTSGRNTKGQLADCLNTTGIYSVVRHPLYLGNFLIGLGAAMVPFQWWLVTVYTLAYWLYYERIMFAEEVFLQRQFGAEFDEWARRTPAFLPSLGAWRPAENRFSFRTVLKREYTALFVVIGLHAGIETAEHWFIEGRIVYEPAWEILLGFGVVSYLIIRTLKKRTHLLNQAGR